MNTELIEKNKDFIAEEVICYLETEHPNFIFEYELMRRDVHMMLDVYLGEFQSEAGIYLSDIRNTPHYEYFQVHRYKKSFTQIREISDGVVAALEYTAELLKKIIQNTPIFTRNTLFKQFHAQSDFLDSTNDTIDRVKGLIFSNALQKPEKNYHMRFIEDFFDKGFHITKIPSHIEEKMWEEIERTNWIYAKFSSTYKKVPDWYRENKKFYVEPSGIDRPDFERKIGDQLFTNAPKRLIDVSQELANTSIFEPIRMYRPPKMITKYLHLWNGAENSPYHVDGIDGSDIICFCYLTEEPEWKKEWGGYINLLKEVDNKILHNTTVLPNNGTMVVVNNASPIFKHGVRNLINRDVNRYTFVFHYIWTF